MAPSFESWNEYASSSTAPPSQPTKRSEAPTLLLVPSITAAPDRWP